MKASYSTKDPHHLPIRKSSRLKDILYSQTLAPYIFVAPFVLIFIGFYAYPFISTFIMSFQSILPGQTTFIGLENYKKLFNPTFYKALYNSSLYTFWTIIILIPVPLLFAVLLNSKLMKLKPAFRAAVFIPALTSTIVAGVIFRLIFAESGSAFANTIMTFIGLPAQEWRMGGPTLMFLMVGLASWRWMGVNLLYFLAGLQNIPEEMYEAAEIDGANTISKFRHITLPYLKPVSIYVLSITLFAGFRMFEESYVFWDINSPGNIGLTVVGYIYKQGFQYNNMGYGSAVGITLLFIVFIICILQLRFSGMFKKEE